MKTYTRGFTLIELLVVIAIIGILSSVVLVSLNSARNKGTDAKIQSTISGIRAASEVYSSNQTNYGTPTTSCDAGMFASNELDPYIESLKSMGTPVCAVSGATGTGYAVSMPLVGNVGRNFCVDSLGNATTTVGNTIGSGSSPAFDTNCN